MLGLVRCSVMLLAVLVAWPAQSQTYPARPIMLVVPFPPGGGNDAMARIIADKLSTTLGQQVVVDNRGGAGGLIGTRAVAKAAPDGYTLLLGHTGTLGINPSLYAPNTGYDIRKDFAPIGLIAVMPMAFMAYPPTPYKTVADLISAAKKEPGKINIGSSPKGTGSHLCAELFMSLSGAQMNLIPYKGTAQSINDLVGGHVSVACNIIPPAFGNIKGGALRPLAVTSAKRSPLLPDVPTVSESGLPGFEAELYYGLLAPAGTPREIVQKLNAELRKALASDDVKQRIAHDAAVPISSTPEEHAALLDRDESKWAALIKKLGLKVN
ncbi:MAG: tripartite tricarboxylate transporter substrate binding protein [Pseudorhodoplanes sp.]|nr:tripartite tricarboxylate transporter substrate binding protein [Pseudorhodoplanes sp.]